MRILFSINSMNCGGAERVISILANKFASEGHIAEIVVHDWPKSFYVLNPKVKYVNIPNCDTSKSSMLYRIKKLRREIIRFKPDVVVSFIADHNIVTTLACVGLRTRVIVSERNDPAKRPVKKFMRIIRNVVYYLADGFVFQTLDARAYFGRFIQNKSTVIVNPFDTQSMPPICMRQRENRIVVVNRLVSQKRVDHVIRAFARLAKEYPYYELDVYGDGPERERLLHLCQVMEVENKVHLHGQIDSVLNEIRSKKIFVLASDFEGMPNTLIEAMCMGLACISTDCPVGGPRMLIQHMKNGILIEPNSEDAIYNALRRMIEEPELTERIAREAVEIRKQVNIDEVYHQWIAYISAIRGE